MIDQRIQDFIVFCIEEYRAENGLSGAEVVELFNNRNVYSFLENNYEMLHSFDRDYIVDTIADIVRK